MKSIWWVALAAGSAAYSLVRQGKDVLPSFRGVAEVRSHLPGRLRLYIPAIARQEEVARTMKETLEAAGAVHSVTLNPRTATALICYDEAQVGAAVIEGAAIRLMGLDAEIAAHTERLRRLRKEWRQCCAIEADARRIEQQFKQQREQEILDQGGPEHGCRQRSR